MLDKTPVTQVFKTSRNFFLVNELKSWFLTSAFAVALYFSVQIFTSISADNFMVGFVIILLLKIADIVIPYHITEIEIDTQKSQLKFKLHSLMSGDKVKTYELRQVSSELVRHSELTKLLSSSLTLKILLTPKDTFKVNNRYGFSAETLASVDNTLKSLNSARLQEL